MRSKRRGRRAGQLGTFGGVFTPSVLTILGIILFRRLGYIVGSAGLLRALMMLGLATLISVLTSISLSAIATNRKVRGGGDYYLISRSLGVEYGGALGLILFAAQAISVAFYCVGFGEGVVSVAGGTEATVRLAATGAAIGLFLLAFAGADLATRFQFVVMAVLGAALVSFFTGAGTTVNRTLLQQSWSAGEQGLPFWSVFAILFPAVTGFTQGVSMSGDLKEPARSLPVGTFIAVGVSTVVYVVAMIALSASLSLDELTSDYDSLKRVSRLPWLIDAGVLSATLSSALASFLGAPRILQALAKDRLFDVLTFFGAGHGRVGNPRRAVVLTAAIAFVTIWIGDLNAIAAIVSMFFLVSYGLLNYATYVEAVAASPSFRPRFRFFHARASLAGTGLCAVVMLMIDPMASAVALGILGAIYHYLRWAAVPVRWHDSRRAYRFRRVKEGLRELADEPEAPSDWQPHILVFTETQARRDRLLQVGAWIAGGSGIITAVHLVSGDGAAPAVQQQCDAEEKQLAVELERHHLDAFPLVVAVPDLRIGATTLLQSWGVGPIRSNTVLLNWLDSRSHGDSPSTALWYARLLQRAARLGQHVVVLDAGDQEWTALQRLDPESRRIDVWWYENDSSRLALLFAYLMTRSDVWDESRLRLLATAPNDQLQKIEANLRHRLTELRIDADIEVVTREDRDQAYDRSKDAAIVFLPLRLEGMKILHPSGGSVEEPLMKLPVVAMVAASGDVTLAEEPDEESAPAPDSRNGENPEDSEKE